MRFVSSWPLLGTGHMSDSPNSFCGSCTSRVGVFTSIFGLSQLRRPVLTPKGLASHLAIRSFFFQICTVAAKIFVHLRSQKKISDLRKKIAETRQNCNSILHTPSHGLCKGSTFQDLSKTFCTTLKYCAAADSFNKFNSHLWHAGLIQRFGTQAGFFWRAEPKPIKCLNYVKAYSSNKQETQHCCTNAENMQHSTIVYW